MMVVPIDAPGVTVVAQPAGVRLHGPRGPRRDRSSTTCGVPAKDVLAGEGEGFVISQARLGPGRIHHCMRAIGMAERALELMCKRAQSRVTFGKPIADNANVQDWIAEARIEHRDDPAAHPQDRLPDGHGRQQGRRGPRSPRSRSPPRSIALKIIDRAIQVHGGAGVTDDFPLAMASTPTCAPCAWPTAPTRCTNAPSRSRELRQYRDPRPEGL